MTPSFQELIIHDFEKLHLYTKAITRAHGHHHPEAFEVRELFKAIQEKLKDVQVHQADLNNEFRQLRTITKNYTIPNDVCKTYAATYQMLERLDKAYQHKKY